MNSIKLEQLITENMKSIFGFSLTRLENVNEAEELASDILYEIIRSSKNLKDKERFYSFMWKIAEHTYADYLRKKSRNVSHTVELEDNILDKSESALDMLIKKENIHTLRRELSLLSKQYRDATVLYYIEGLSCSEIANKLRISTEMVKYYLFRARKIIREGMNMKRLYGEKSYHPNYVKIDFWGTKAGDDREYYDFQSRKIKGNILLAAYYAPVTLQEISIELGVALPYLEDEIKLLVDREYLVTNNDKYLTNVPIFTLDCKKSINEKLKELTIDIAKKFISAEDNFDLRFGDRFANENLARWQKVLLCINCALNITQNTIEQKYGKLPIGGPYSYVNGGGGKGIVWAYEDTTSIYGNDREIRGIYTALPSGCEDEIIAINFKQILNAQHMFMNLAHPLTKVAHGDFDNLPEDAKNQLTESGYVKDGKANFAVWTFKEYDELQEMLKECTGFIVELYDKTIEIAADIASDLAPAHIRKTAEYVGAFAYRFNSIENLANALFDMGWLKSVDAIDKPAVCVVKG